MWPGGYAPRGLEALQAQALVEGEDEEEPDALGEVLATCEGIAARVRALVGRTTQDGCAPRLAA